MITDGCRRRLRIGFVGIAVAGVYCLGQGRASAEFLRVAQVGAANGVFLTFDATVTGSNSGPFDGAGFAPTPGVGQLDSDSWAVSAGSASVNFGGSAGSGFLARGFYPTPGNPPNAGGVNAADVDSAAGSQNRALGMKLGNGFAPASLYLRIVNATGLTATSWEVGHDLYYRNDTTSQTRASLEFAVGSAAAADPTSLTYLPTKRVFTTLQGATTESWALASNMSSAVAALVPNGEALYLRWRFEDVLLPSSGNLRDGFAIDNVRVGVSGTNAVPEPASTLLTGLAAVAGAAGYWRRRRKAVPEVVPDAD